MKKYFVDCKVTIGCAIEIEADSEKEAVELIKEAGNFSYSGEGACVDIAHFEIEADAVELKK
jgi:hypothetical protein